jgi:TolB-like protein/DNA-binding winged helix-turn-helix (wHTH) protein/tetratricopeptide (TPR) repeat protein
MPAPGPAPRSLRFDVFELDLRTGELRKHGSKLRLQGQPLQLLALLLQNAGELVTREELRNQLWPADTFVDFDHSLHNAIGRIREALSDSAETPRYIETLPRRGYRFIAPVARIGDKNGHAITDPLAASASPQMAEAPVRQQGTKLRRLSAIGLLTLAAVAIALWLARTPSPQAMTAAPLRSIAVLPLDNLSGDPSQDYFVDGMTDQLITDLAKIGALRVTSRRSVMRYKGTRQSLPEIARELNVDAIVEGSVMRSGNRVRITAQLLHAPADQHLWAETYEREMGDVFRLQSEVTRAIAQQVRVQLTSQEEARLSSARPVIPEAYEPYIRGRFYLTNEFTNPHSLEIAQHYFEQSISRDPRFALAYVGLADSYSYSGLSGRLSSEFAHHSALEAIHKALELDSSIGEAHDTLGLLKWRYEWNWDGAEREFNQAIAMSPSYSCAREDRAVFLAFSGRRDEALAELNLARDLDRSPSFALTESSVYFGLRDYQGLIAASQKGIVVDPKEWLQHSYLAAAYEGTGKNLEAIAEYEKVIEMTGGDQGSVAALAYAYALTGRKAQAENIVRDLEQKSKTTYVSPYIFAVMYAGLGEKDRAFRFLEQAYAEKSLDISWGLQADLRLDNLRSDPRFQSLKQRVGIAE